MNDIKEQFKERWKSVLLSAGIEEKYLTGRHTPCIFCNGKDRARWIEPDEYYWCNSCSPMTPIDVYMRFTGLSFKDACNKIRGSKVWHSEQKKKVKIDPMLKLKRVHSKLKKTVEGDPVDLYLNSRGITLRADNILTGATMPYYGGGKVPGIYDCMVSRITNVDGHLESYHIVYLTPEGRKIDNAPAKIIITPLNTITGCSVKIGDCGDVLAIAEGIETALKVSEEEGIVCWAGVSANGMEKIVIPESVKRVFIYADNDSSYAGQAAAYNLAKRLTARGLEVKVFMPELEDTDFLDEFNR